mmetsp:Transcript_19472/g.46473  ORF Transcript_19472/g.46473 Transcript_19472/m.46473 type:complete len:340 (+) Transcript_19472:200-1219(+)
MLAKREFRLKQVGLTSLSALKLSLQGGSNAENFGLLQTSRSEGGCYSHQDPGSSWHSLRLGDAVRWTWNGSLGKQTLSDGLRQSLEQARDDAGRLKLLSFCGGGVYFWWQLGVSKFLREHYDLSKTKMLGASGGAFAATLTACGVSAEMAFASALRQAQERNLLDKPLGMLGVWGQQLRDWLHELLPPEAADLCRERVQLLVTEFPLFKELALGNFKDRWDLIEVNMASAHVPLVLDYRLTALCRGRMVIDGGMKDWIFRSRSKAIAVEGAVMIDHHDDNRLVSKRMDMSKPLSSDAVRLLIDTGYDYGVRQESLGKYDHLDPLLPRQSPAPTGAAQEQ